MLSGAPQRAVVRVPGALIQVEDQALHIPLLPRNRLDARWNLPKAQVAFEAAAKVVDHYLATLRTPLLGPDAETAVPASQAAEAKLLLARLQDEKFAGLMADLLKELKAWDADSRTPRPKDKIASDEDRKGGAEVLRYVPISPGTPAGQTPIDDLSPNGPFRNPDASNGGGAWDVHATPQKKLTQPFLRDATAVRDELNAGESQAMAVARRHEGQSTARWAAVLGQLETEAKAVAELTAVVPDPATPALLELRRRAKLQLVERYQASLKLCRFIWVSLAAEPRGKASS
jgi:hypothetical protein